MDGLRHVSVEDMLRARDERVLRQQDFLNCWHAPLISFTMNIAGSVKNTPGIQRAFEEGVFRIGRQLERMNAPVLAFEKIHAFTGCEALWAVDAPADELKRRMCLLEEQDALGRLFDIDVLAPDGSHLSRETERACLLCGGPVRICARSRAHSAQELFERANGIIRAHFDGKFIQKVGEIAQKALLYEALTTPKPGLVDCENNGAHRDMDLFSFAASACALRPYFETCVRLGMQNAPPEVLQQAGLDAEDTMFAAARANTHKGAIFALGILCHAAGRLGEGFGVEDVCREAARTGAAYLKQMTGSNRAQTGGEQQYRQYGLTGARGEAAGGFANVRDTALPALENALESGCSLPEAGLHALLALMACVQDSNLLRRAGTQGQQWAMQQARKLLQTGWSKNDLRQLNERFVQKNLSPGGSADLLAVTYFLHFAKEL